LEYTFSSTTIASSQTRPIASTNPTRVRMLMEKPATYMMKNALMMLTGIASTGMMVARQSRKKAKMISATRMNAISNVSRTSETDLRT
jgi:hypothetical protein